jgi:hypothetical protein
MKKISVGSFWMKFGSAGDIGIPNGPAEDGTRGLLEAHDSKNKEDSEAQDTIKEN